MLSVMGYLWLASTSWAHQVPSLSVESSFSKDGTFVMTINVDPRLFLSEQPSSLPPVPVEWYRDQSDAERAATHASATAYLKKALQLDFSGNRLPLPDCSIRPMDGSTNSGLTDETKEVHLLAELKGKIPAGSQAFRAVLAPNAGVSMILLSSFEGEMEKRPNVVFPGESSREFKLPLTPVAPAAPTPQATASAQPAHEKFPLLTIGIVVGVIALLLTIWKMMQKAR